jgi:ParB family chromosome partitioning protein
MSAPVTIDVPRQEPETGSSPPLSAARPQDATDAGEPSRAPAVGIRMLAVEDVRPNPSQPRRDFDPDALQRLGQSIRSAGLMQPIVVRPHQRGYLLVAGERRWRAAQLIGLAELPAIVRDLDDRTAAQLALVENLQREDLNPIERAEAFRRLIDDFGLTHQDIAKHVGLDRSSVSNHLRLLELDEDTTDALRTGRLSMGHGRALLAITNEVERAALARQSDRQGWSVRELERRIRDRTREAAETVPRREDPRHAHMKDLERRLGDHLGTKVTLNAGRKKGAGTLTIAFYSLDEFEGLMERLGFRYE